MFFGNSGVIIVPVTGLIDIAVGVDGLDRSPNKCLDQISSAGRFVNFSLIVLGPVSSVSKLVSPRQIHENMELTRK